MTTARRYDRQIQWTRLPDVAPAEELLRATVCSSHRLHPDRWHGPWGGMWAQAFGAVAQAVANGVLPYESDCSVEDIERCPTCRRLLEEGDGQTGDA